MNNVIMVFENKDEANKVLYNAMEAVIAETDFTKECGSVHDFLINANIIREKRNENISPDQIVINGMESYPNKNGMPNQNTKAAKRAAEKKNQEIRRSLKNKCIIPVSYVDRSLTSILIDRVDDTYKHVI